MKTISAVSVAAFIMGIGALSAEAKITEFHSNVYPVQSRLYYSTISSPEVWAQLTAPAWVFVQKKPKQTAPKETYISMRSTTAAMRASRVSQYHGW